MRKKLAGPIALGAGIGLAISRVPGLSVTRFYGEDWIGTSVGILPGYLAVGVFLGALIGWVVAWKKF